MLNDKHSARAGHKLGFALVQTEPIGHWGGGRKNGHVLSRLKCVQGLISVVVRGSKCGNGLE